MNSYLHGLTDTKEYLEQLNIDEHTNALWDVLHQARWHKGIDWVRWIDENKPLVQKLITHKYFPLCPDELKKEVWKSIYELKEQDR